MAGCGPRPYFGLIERNTGIVRCARLILSNDHIAKLATRRRPPGEELYVRAVAIVRTDRKASTEYLQQRLGIRYMRAADLIERMEQEGILGAPVRNGTRPILRRPPRSRPSSPASSPSASSSSSTSSGSASSSSV